MSGLHGAIGWKKTMSNKTLTVRRKYCNFTHVDDDLLSSRMSYVGCKLVPYRRVSTAKQGESGLGLEAQDAAIQAYAASTGCEIIATYTEIETGKKDDIANRPELLKAVAHAKRAKAVLVIAKLDRLSRSVFVTATLHKAGVEFVACDNPTANRLTIQILAVIAENEARMISQRTKDALKAYKSSGRLSKRIRLLYPDGVPKEVIEATAGKLGASLPQCRNLTAEGRERGIKNAAARHRARANEAYVDLMPDMTTWYCGGMTLQEIADRLNSEGQSTRRQEAWNKVQVARVLKRAGITMKPRGKPAMAARPTSRAGEV
jgi:DNA invertase Pin-like site-specific DNA recombinase